MTKTTNYSLPQWEAGDPIRWEDFNGAMQAIDAGVAAAQGAAESVQETLAAGLTPTGKVVQIGRFTVTPSAAAGSTLLTFPFTPQGILVEMGNVLLIIEKASERSYSVGGGTYNVRLGLSGNELILKVNSGLTANATGLYITWP